MINDVSNAINKPNRRYPSNVLAVDPSDYRVDYEGYAKDHLNERVSNNALKAVRSMIATIDKVVRNEIQTAPGADTLEEAFCTGEAIICRYGKK
ncbi:MULTISPECIES: hypothetical protein [Pseudomonas]|uniref:Uncharacterized protein n=1 Tax=Pseudomonas helleri TaxID=1608996 RepID=A0A7X2BWC2_9PSED|nr:hypothetical protein [Pseudomonas helleri]MQT77291.1 hypothetical protein [Pseudomonas helleri]